MENEENAVLEEDIDMSGWDDEESEVTTEDSAEPEAEAEETEDAVTEEAGDESDEEDQPAEEKPEEPERTEQEAKEQEPPKEETFTLKHLGETKDYSREETVALAQKGLDYDRIRTERDALKADAPKYKDYENFLTEVADAAGVTVDQLMEDIRTRSLVERESKAGRPLTTTAAREQIRKEKEARFKTEPQPEQPAPQQTEDPRREAKHADIQKFALAHPDVKGTDIPEEVWNEYRNSDSTLEELYTTRVLYPKLQKELKEATQKLAEMEQKQKNASRSTGSRKSAGAGRAQDPAMIGWDD